MESRKDLHVPDRGPFIVTIETLQVLLISTCLDT